MSTGPDDYQPPPPFKWEARAVFRETFLFNLTQPGAADSLRHLGSLFYGLVLDSCERWPDWPETPTRADLRAAVADLFHLQGFLASVWEESEVASVPAADLPLCKKALHWSRRAARLAREIETALGGLPEPEHGGEVP
jgi:hypothetical protein